MVFFCDTVFRTQIDVKWKFFMKMVKVAFHALLLMPLLELLMYINLGLFTVEFCFPLFAYNKPTKLHYVSWSICTRMKYRAQ